MRKTYQGNGHRHENAAGLPEPDGGAANGTQKDKLKPAVTGPFHKKGHENDDQKKTCPMLGRTGKERKGSRTESQSGSESGKRAAIPHQVKGDTRLKPCRERGKNSKSVQVGAEKPK